MAKIITDKTQSWESRQHTCQYCQSVYVLDSPSDFYFKEQMDGRGEKWDEIYHDCPACKTPIKSSGTTYAPSWVKRQSHKIHNKGKKKEDN